MLTWLTFSSPVAKSPAVPLSGSEWQGFIGAFLELPADINTCEMLMQGHSRESDLSTCDVVGWVGAVDAAFAIEHKRASSILGSIFHWIHFQVRRSSGQRLVFILPMLPGTNRFCSVITMDEQSMMIVRKFAATGEATFLENANDWDGISRAPLYCCMSGRGGRPGRIVLMRLLLWSRTSNPPRIALHPQFRRLVRLRKTQTIGRQITMSIERYVNSSNRFIKLYPQTGNG